MRRHLPRKPTHDVSDAIEDYLTGTLDVDEDLYDYGVYATLTGRVLTIQLTFLGHEMYCCAVPECHLDFDDEDHWEKLRNLCEDYGVELPDLCSVQGEILVREGACFDGSCGRETPKDPHGQRFVLREERE